MTGIQEAIENTMEGRFVEVEQKNMSQKPLKLDLSLKSLVVRPINFVFFFDGMGGTDNSI
jgi:hypothetical protein